MPLLRTIKKKIKGGAVKAPAVTVMPYQRVVIDGQELLVRRIISITADEIVYEDPSGTIRTLKRRAPRKGRRRGLLSSIM